MNLKWIAEAGGEEGQGVQGKGHEAAHCPRDPLSPC